MKRVLVIDNHDSFVYNLVQILRECENCQFDIVYNDNIDFSALNRYDKLLLSPGPGIPAEAGDLLPLIDRCKHTHSILGVCLGHQAICDAFGGKISYASKLMHGKSSTAKLNKDPIFKGLNDEIAVGRYHSLSLVENTLPKDLKIISKTADNGEIMAIKHKKYNVYGLQFHPESILTPDGITIIENFINKIKEDN